MADDAFLKMVGAEKSRTAQANLHGAQEVPAANAVGAIKAAPETGVDPSLAMSDPAFGTSIANFKRDQSYLSNPAIQSLASKSPAHVAATREDWPALARVGELAKLFGFGAEVGLTDLRRQLMAPQLNAMQLRGPQLLPNPMSILGGQLKRLEMKGMEARGFEGVPEDPAGRAAFMAGTFSLGALARGSALNRLLQAALPLAGEEAGYYGGREIAGEKGGEIGSVLGAVLGGLPPTLRFNRRNVVDLGTARRVGEPERLVGPQEPVVDAEFEPVRPPGVSPKDTELYTLAAENDATAVKEIETALAATSTQKQLPALTREFLEGTEVAGQRAWVDAGTIAELYAQGETPFADMQAEVMEALAAGRDVEMPLARYLSEVSGQPYAEQLRGVTRFREDGVSQEDSATLPQPKEDEPSAPALREVSFPEDLEPELQGPVRELAAKVDASVEEVFAEQMLTSLFTDAKALKMGKTQFERYDAMLSEAKAAASERILERTYNQIRRERTPDWKATLAQREAEVERELAQLPQLQAFSELSRGKGTLGEPLERGIKFNTDSQLGKYARDLGLPRTMFSKDGMEPDDAAILLGYPSGTQLILALADVNTAKGDLTFEQYVKGLVSEEATNRARGQLGYDVSQEGLLAAAREAAVLPQVEDFLEASLRDLADEAGLPFDKGIVKAEAERQFQDMQVSVASNPRTFSRGMMKNGNKVERAMLEGKFPDAFIARQQQLFNFYQHGMSLELKRNLGITQRKFSRLAKRKSWKSRAQENTNYAQVFLTRLGYDINRNPQELAASIEFFNGGQPLTLEQWVAEQQSIGEPLNAVPLVQTPLEQQTVAQFWETREFVNRIDKRAKEKMELVTARGREEYEVVMQMFLNSVADLSTNPQRATVGDNRTFGEAGKSFISAMDATQRKALNIFQYMDNQNPDGVMTRVLDGPAQEAQDTHHKYKREVTNRISAAFDVVYKKVGAERYRSILPNDVLLDPRTDTPLSLYYGDLLPVMLNMGTNLEKLALGWGTEPEILTAWVNQHATRDMWDFVEEVWQTLEDFEPTVSAVERRTSGVGVEKLPNTKIETPFGTITGKYYPIRYDYSRARAQLRRERGDPKTEAAAMLNAGKPGAGFLEKRTSVIDPIDLSLNRVLGQHVEEIVTRAAFLEFYLSARRFIADPRVRDAVSAKMGPEYYNQLMPWLKDMIVDWMSGSGQVGVIEKLMREMRLNFNAAIMGGSFTTMVAQPLGLFTAASELGPTIREANWVIAKALAQTSSMNDVELNEAIYSKSEFMLEQKLATDPVQAESRAIVRNMAPRRPGGPLVSATVDAQRDFRNWSLSLISYVQRKLVNEPVWRATYLRELEALGGGGGGREPPIDGEPPPLDPEIDREAARRADRMVRKTQGSGRKGDLAAIQRQRSEFARLFQIAYNWPNTFYNLQQEMGVNISRGEWQKTWNKFWMLLAVPIVLGALVQDPNDHPDWEDPLDVAGYISRKFFFGMFNGVFGARDVASATERSLAGKRPTFGSTPINRILENEQKFIEMVWKRGVQGKPAKQHEHALKKAFNAAGVVLPMASQLGKSTEYLADLMTGEEEFSENPLGIVYGPSYENRKK